MKSWWMLMTDVDTALELRDVPLPEPGPGQLRVRVQAASLNRGEFVLGHGLHGKAGSWKAVGGEAAGVVDALGAGVQGWQVGDRAMGRCAGGFSEYALLDTAEAMAVPAALSWDEAAAIPLAYMVAFDMLVLQGRLQAGEWMLINGVSSGVGVAALQLGKALGARVIGTSGSADKLEMLQTQGLEAVWFAGRMALAGRAQLDAMSMSSRLSTLRPMGSYRLELTGGEVPALALSTLQGPLQLTGSGQWVSQRLRFAGEASAAPDREAALANLLNIIGRRSGARSLITVG